MKVAEKKRHVKVEYLAALRAERKNTAASTLRHILIFKLSFNFMCMGVLPSYLYAVHAWYLEARRGHRNPCDGSYKCLLASMQLLGEEPVLLTTVLSPRPQTAFLNIENPRHSSNFLNQLLIYILITSTST